MSYEMRVKKITSQTRGYKDMQKFKTEAEKYKEGKNVVIKKGIMKNLQGTITGKPQIVWSKKFMLLPIRVRDMGSAIKSVVGTNKFYFTNKEIELTGHKYKHVVPFSSK